MTFLPRFLGVTLALLLGSGVAYANEYDDTIELFKHAGESAVFFTDCYAYAVFPTIGAGGLIVGGARGKGQVFVHDQPVGDAVMTQLSFGLQAGGKAYSKIIFFQDKRYLDEFESGKFEFAAGASAVAIRTGASASVGTDQASSGASGGEKKTPTKSRSPNGRQNRSRSCAACEPQKPRHSCEIPSSSCALRRWRSSRLRSLFWRANMMNGAMHN